MVLGFKSNHIFKNGSFQKGSIFFDDKQILAKGKVTEDLQDAFILPRLIDLQVNGGFGIDLTSEPERVEELAKHLYELGVGAFCPTLISMPLSKYKSALKHFKPRKVKGGAEILGAHLEGPFLSIPGAHNEKHLINETDIPLENVRMITLSPEKISPSFIAKLRKKRIVISAGHSNADISSLIKLKIPMVTHLFNAMPFHHRAPGLIDYALTQPVYYSLIADNKHISDSVYEIARKANPEGLILVSDLAPGFQSKKKKFRLGDREFKKGELAGSEMSLIEMVLRTGNVAAATTHPAQLLGLTNIGNLNPQSSSDFLIIRHE